MEFKKLLKNTSFLAGTRIVQFIAGLVRTKLVATLLGTLGTGLVNQLTFLTQRLSEFTLLSMSEALVKQIAENKNSNRSTEIINSAYKIYILLVSIFMIISCLILYFFSERLTIYVFGDFSYISYFYVGVFSFPLLILDSIPFSILKAFKNVRIIAKARIISVIINLFFAILLILIFKLPGAIAYVPISYLISLIINFLFAKSYYFKKMNISIKTILKSPVNLKFIKELLLFSSFGLTVGVFAIISEFFCRSIVVSNLGIDNIGLYSPIIMWASLVTGFILPSFSTYLYPRFCEVKSNEEISSLLNDGIRLGTFAVLPLLLLGIPYKELFISLFYSDEFLESTKYLPYHFIGIIFYVWWYVFSQSMTPTGRIKEHGFFLSLYFLLDIIVTYIFVTKYGLYGWMLKHTVSPFVFFWIYFIYARKNMDFKIQYSNIILMSYLLLSTFLIVVINFYDMKLINYLLGPILIGAIFWILKIEEKNFIKKKILKIINR